MYRYYEQASVAPTFADFRDEAAIARYADAREALLARRLALPPQIFRGADVLEFGPDTGENALVFARWGARLTLVEPVAAAHDAIRRYFGRFAPQDALLDVTAADVLGYVPPRHFDMVVAEGFIHTVKPDAAWLAAFARALTPGGLALESHYERTATLFELSLKVPFATLHRRGSDDAMTIAERCYRTKWDRIPHTRAFASWVMDVLQNPFQRLALFCDAAELLTAAYDEGFDLYASWPVYTDSLINEWSKRRPTPEETLARNLAHVERSVLSTTLGTKAYVFDLDIARSFRRLLDAAVADTDSLIDVDDPATSARLAATLREIAARANAADVLVDDGEAFTNALGLFDAWAQVHEALARGDDAAALAVLNTNVALLDGWGNPNHLAVWRLRTG